VVLCVRNEGQETQEKKVHQSSRPFLLQHQIHPRILVIAHCMHSTSPSYFLARSIASFHMEEYEAAKEAFDAGALLEPGNQLFKTWTRKCQAELEGEAHVQVTMRLACSFKSTLVPSCAHP